MPTTVFLCPVSAIFQWFTDAGIILSGGKINTYLAGTSTPTQTFTDSTGVTPNSNPLILGSNGRLNGTQIWQPQGISLKLVITDSNSNQLGPVFDQITGINDPSTIQALYANPATGFGADLIANVVRSYDLVSSVRAANVPSLAAGQTLVIDVEAGATPGDGFGGLFFWNASSTATDDGGITAIKPTSISGGNPGRYLRQTQAANGSFTGTLTGMTATTTGTVNFKVISGVLVVLQAAFTGTSAAGAPGNVMTLTGLPSNCIPPTIGPTVRCSLTDNGTAAQSGWAAVNTAGVVTFGIGLNNNTSGFTSGGTKGLSSGCTIIYPLT